MPASQVMHEFKHGKLHSGSKKGPIVKNRKQAIAIMLSEKRKGYQFGGAPNMFGQNNAFAPNMFSSSPVTPAMQPASPATTMGPPMGGGFGSMGAGQGLGMGQSPQLPNTAGLHPDATGGSSYGNREAQPGQQQSNQLPTWMQGATGLPANFQQQLSSAISGGVGSPAWQSLMNLVPHPQQDDQDRGREGGGRDDDDDRQQQQPRTPPPTYWPGNWGAVGGVPAGGPGTVAAKQAGGGLPSAGAYLERQDFRQDMRNMTHTGPIMSTVAGRTDHHAINVPSGSYVLPAAHVSAIGQGNTLSGMKVLGRMFGSAPYGMGGGSRVAHGPGAPKIGFARPPKPVGGFQAGGMPGDVSVDDGGNIQLAGDVVYGPGRWGLEPRPTPSDRSLGEMFMEMSPARRKEYGLPEHPPQPIQMTPRTSGLDVSDYDSDLSSTGGSRHSMTGRPVPIMAAGGEYVLSPQQVMRVGNGDLNRGHRILDEWVKMTHKKYAKTIANLPPPAKT